MITTDPNELLARKKAREAEYHTDQLTNNTNTQPYYEEEDEAEIEQVLPTGNARQSHDEPNQLKDEATGLQDNRDNVAQATDISQQAVVYGQHSIDDYQEPEE